MKSTDKKKKWRKQIKSSDEMSQDVGKSDETEWEDEQIGREYWLKSHEKIKEWMGKNDERRW